VLAKLLDTETVNARVKTAAASALANITDHDVRHCQALLNIKKMEFWLQLLSTSTASSPLVIAALHLIESLSKNVPNVRAKVRKRKKKNKTATRKRSNLIKVQAIPQLQGVEAICRIFSEADNEDLAIAAIDCLEEVCRGVSINLNTALLTLQVSSLPEALRKKETALQTSGAMQARKRARGGGRDEQEDYAGKRIKDEEQQLQQPTQPQQLQQLQQQQQQHQFQQLQQQQQQLQQQQPLLQQMENTNPSLPMLNLKELNVAEKDVARVSGGRALVPSNAVLELLLKSMKEQRLSLDSALQNVATLEVFDFLLCLLCLLTRRFARVLCVVFFLSLREVFVRARLLPRLPRPPPPPSPPSSLTPSLSEPSSTRSPAPSRQQTQRKNEIMKTASHF
jgi:hypothetical protein